MLSFLGGFNTTAYTASKHAIEGYAECLAQEVTPFGIQVMLIEPGDHRGGSSRCRLTSAGMTDASPYWADFRKGTEAIRRDEELDNLHSIYVDQWDWEKVITADQRTLDFLQDTVRDIVDAVCATSDELRWKFPELKNIHLDRDVTFITTQELEDMYPDYTSKQRENAFAKEHGVNIVAGSVSVLENGCVFNRSYIFDRKGEVVASYDKIHGFSPMGETKSYTGGSSTVHFTLDGIACSMAICYDVRFCELIRTEALQGVDLFFLPAAWPLVRREHWITLSKARAIENQMFFCAVNECGRAGSTQYGGNSMLLSPLGEELLHLGEKEQVATAEIDTDVLQGIRESINVFRDRRPELYHL